MDIINIEIFLNFLNKNDEIELVFELLSYQNPYNDETLMITMCRDETNGDVISGILYGLGVGDNENIVKLLKEQKDVKTGDSGIQIFENSIKQYSSI